MQNIYFVDNLIPNTSCEFYCADINVASGKSGNIAP